MVEINGPVMYSVGWTGLIGPVHVTITEINIGRFKFKKAISASNHSEG